MDESTSKKLIAVALIGVILAAAAAWMATKDRSVTVAPVTDGIAASDPFKAEFERCQLLGEAGAHDPACLAAWAENRRRFLSPDRRPAAPNPGAVTAAPTPALTGAR